MLKKITVTTALAATVLAGGVAQTEASAQSDSQQKNIKIVANQSLQSFNKEEIQNWINQHLSDYQLKWDKQQQAPKQQQKEEQPQQATTTQQQPQQEQEATQQQQQSEQQSTELSQYEQKVVELTNEERKAQGLEPLQIDKELSNVAEKKSEDMAANNYFSHNSPTYGSPFDMMDQFGVDYRTAGENIAKGQRTPQEVVDGWMNSEGHRKNIMNESFTHIGVGYVEDGNIWTQQFIGK
ncbi:CAP domain-containing protein [Pontibacillus salicampi]|uniref:CAP domain-containing protein n=1 Tax=Pontibacillus salicampi TaxID=1449801 RepID=A0ABV6LMD2_9BACI